MPCLTRLLSGLAAVVLVLPAWGADALPRYQFKPGQELIYKSKSDFKYGEGNTAGAHEYSDEWTVWVVRANTDGSYRLVVRNRNTFAQTRDGKTNAQPARTQIVYADVFPDGRVLPNKSIQYRGHPGNLFPPLPQNEAEAKAGWSASRQDDRVVCKPTIAPGTWGFESVTESPMDKVYLSSKSAKYTFDMNRGLIAKAETTSTQGYGFKGSGAGTLEVVEVKNADPAELKQFAADAERYFTACGKYEADTEVAGRAKPAQAKQLLTKSFGELKEAAEAVKQTDLKAELDERVKKHEQTAKYALAEAERRAEHLGKAAEDFETTDIDDKKIKLSDLRGQVVVLDFWYRGCGWCIKAMPQMNQLAADFEGQPVRIFGMNTDQNVEDAKFVIDKMGLKYTTLKAEGLPQKFGVQGFPTLIIIDQQGKIADIHVGYTPTLRDDVGKQIRELLAAK